MPRTPTPLQQQAIEAAEPVVVVTAGAGSGKTFVLVERIVQVLQQRKVELWELAAITFTNKATQEMRERLQHRLHEAALAAPPSERLYWRRQLEAVGDAAILTIHAFCRRVLTMSGVVIGVDPNFDVSGEGAGMGEVIHEVVGSHLDDNDLTLRYEPWRVRKYVAQVIQQAQQLGVTPEQARRETLARLGGRLSADDRAYKSLNHLCDLAEEADNEGLERRLAARRLDSTDLLRLTRKLLEQEPAVRDQVAARYPFILVDEFQDTDPVQVAILHQLQLASCPPSLTVVGDPKQSIYRFRGADHEAFAQMVADLTGQGRQPLRLAENFRSVPPVVDAVNQVFGDFPEPFQGGEMTPRRPQPGGAGRTTAFRLKQGESPARETVRRILRLLRDQPYTNPDGGPLRVGDIAVLCRTGSQVAEIGRALANARVDHILLGGQGFWQAPEIVEVALVLTAITTGAPHVTFAALTGPYFRAEPGVVRRAMHLRAYAPAWTWESVPPEIPSGSERQLLEKAVVCLRQLHELAAIGLPTQVLECLWQTTGRRLQFRRSGQLQALANLEKLKKLVSSRENGGMVHSFQLADFLAGMYQFVTLEPQAELVDTASGIVRVATIHKSKGLEFPVVFIPYVERSLVRPNDDLSVLYLRGRGLSFEFHDKDKLPDWQDFQRAEATATRAEEVRVLYVALTRAQEGLHPVARPSSSKNSWLQWIEPHFQWQA